MIDLDVDARELLREVETSLRRIELAGYNLKPLFKAVRSDVRKDQTEHRKAMMGPDGRWQTLAQSTIMKRRQRTRKQGRVRRKPPKSRLDRILGKLPNAYLILYNEHSLHVVPRVKWWRAQFDGGRVGRGAKLPPRPFHWASSTLLNTIANKAVDFMLGAWERRNRL